MDWIEWLTTGGALAALGVALATWLRTRPAMKLAETQAEGPLWAEIAALRAELKRERELCDERIGRIEDRHDKDVDELKGEISGLRHDRNNLRQHFNTMVAMLKQPDADVPKVVATIEEMMVRGDMVLAAEKGARRRKG